MKCKVLRTFRIATDAMGIQSVELKPGDIHDIPDHSVPSLQAAGFVMPIAQATEPAPEPTAEQTADAGPDAEPDQAESPKPRKKKS